jgi:hypothetical protein
MKERTKYIKKINMNPLLKWIYLKNKYVIPREIPNNPEQILNATVKFVSTNSRRTRRASVSHYNVVI